MLGRKFATVLCVGCTAEQRRSLRSRLKSFGYALSEVSSGHEGVAFCASNAIQGVLLDAAFLDQVEGWSLAQSLKMVRPSVPILLLDTRHVHSSALPNGIDAVCRTHNSQEVFAHLQRLLGRI